MNRLIIGLIMALSLSVFASLPVSARAESGGTTMVPSPQRGDETTCNTSPDGSVTACDDTYYKVFWEGTRGKPLDFRDNDTGVGKFCGEANSDHEDHGWLGMQNGEVLLNLKLGQRETFTITVYVAAADADCLDPEVTATETLTITPKPVYRPKITKPRKGYLRVCNLNHRAKVWFRYGVVDKSATWVELAIPADTCKKRRVRHPKVYYFAYATQERIEVSYGWLRFPQP